MTPNDAEMIKMDCQIGLDSSIFLYQISLRIVGELEDEIPVTEEIEILSSNDLKLKFLGEILSNESSRTILILITGQEMPANDIAEKTGMRLSLVIHHLNKMLQTDIVKAGLEKIQKTTM